MLGYYFLFLSATISTSLYVFCKLFDRDESTLKIQDKIIGLIIVTSPLALIIWVTYRTFFSHEEIDLWYVGYITIIGITLLGLKSIIDVINRALDRYVKNPGLGTGVIFLTVLCLLIFPFVEIHDNHMEMKEMEEHAKEYHDLRMKIYYNCKNPHHIHFQKKLEDEKWKIQA